MKRIAIYELLKLLLPLLLIIGGRQCYADTVSIPLRYYHSDHLGSASWITNGNGTPVQYLQYMPYGEPFVNERTTGYEERFTFTGKERDSETGYSYFGARFYDSDLMTGWLSVDPQSDKFPNISPYNYCNWNPIKLKDQDGEAPWLIAGAIGAVINASVNVAGAIMDNKSASEIFASGVGGAVSGFITGATSIVNPIRMVSSGIIGAGAEGLGNLVEQGINVAFGNQKEIDYSKVVVSGSIGALGNLASKGVEKGVKKVIEKPIQEKAIKKAIKKDEKLAGRPINGKAARQRINIETNLRINNIKSEKEFLKQNEKKIERATNVTTALVGNRVNNVIEK
ncbi:MAG: RHS repeat-associated core domain-containing protein [Bacteroidales bacterium]|nr:RHS repeat-associated core domain-containing protein [Bacteroidales bacterium]